MLKTIVTLMRGAAAKADEEFADRSALLILDQQIRDAAAGIERSKRALALAIAQDEAEGKRLETTSSHLADLEERAVAALQAGREDLAGEAAEAIAVMEADRDAVQDARARFAAETAQLKLAARNAAHRLAELERGRRIAQAAESVRRMRAGENVAGTATLAEAEATLKRLRERQAEDAAASAALASLDAIADPKAVADRLESAGFGKRARSTAADVLDRLRRKSVPPAA